MAFDSNAQRTRMVPPQGCNFTDLPGVRYNAANVVGVLPEHVEALEAQGWSRADQPPVRPRTPEENQAIREAMERASWRQIPAGGPMARVIPPLAGTIQIEGRVYDAKGGAAFDCPLEDARILAANSWLLFGLSGALESRPAQPRGGEIFVETPAERVMQFDGKAWRDIHSGVAV